MVDDHEVEARIAEIRQRHTAIVAPELLFAVSEGWLDLIDDGLSKIEEYLRSVGCLDGSRVVQIKEKFGELRVYVRPLDGHEWSEAIAMGLADIRDEITNRSATICEICGEPGQIEVVGHYHQALCPEHAAKRLAWVEAGRPDIDWR
jgi:hypothetical protein